jgi:hypothetical protein
VGGERERTRGRFIVGERGFWGEVGPRSQRDACAPGGRRLLEKGGTLFFFVALLPAFPHSFSFYGIVRFFSHLVFSKKQNSSSSIFLLLTFGHASTVVSKSFWMSETRIIKKLEEYYLHSFFYY